MRNGGSMRRKDGTFELYLTEQPDACLCEPEMVAGGFIRAPAYLPTVRYPTLAEISEHARRGTDLSHHEVVSLIAEANAPPVDLNVWWPCA